MPRWRQAGTAALVNMSGRSSATPSNAKAKARLEALWRVRGFDNDLIFYQPLAQGIDVLRVVYATRDLPGLFLSEPGEG